MIVELSEAFKTGNLNSELFRDIPQMSNAELMQLYQFMSDVANGVALKGKNKPSWKDDNMADLPDTQFYKEAKLWHYHCGDSSENPNKIYTAVLNLEKNLKGQPSAEAIHYQKLSKEHIFIIAYSPKHQPFPKATAMLNPLLLRQYQ